MPFASYVNFGIHKLLIVQKNYYLSSDSHTNTVICDGNDYPQRYPSICQTVKTNSKTAMKRPQSTFAAELRKANYSSISIMRLKLAELNRPFAASDHVVQNRPCWRASSLLFPHWDIKTKASQASLVQVSLF